MIWKNPIDLDFINNISKKTMSEHVGIMITDIGEDYIKATMPVDHRTRQPLGLLHGGASVVLSETLGSIASIIAAGPYGQYTAVGVEISAHHLNSAKSGLVTGICKPMKIGKTIQVWVTDIYDESGTHICSSKLTTFIKKLQNQ